MTEESRQCVFLGLPRYPGNPPPEGELPGHLKIVPPVRRGSFKAAVARTSSAEFNFNRLWATALNARPQCTHFAMQHDDVEALAGWCDTLIDEMDYLQAQVCSAVVCIKDGRGLTSTALRDSATGVTRRLTLEEVYALPETFGVGDVVRLFHRRRPKPTELLAVNTGLVVWRLTDSWCEHFPGFDSTHGVVRGKDGTWRAGMVSEDWQFSEWMHTRGQRVLATRKVGTIHHDRKDGKEYPSDRVWGEWEYDLGDDAPSPAPAEECAEPIAA